MELNSLVFNLVQVLHWVFGTDSECTKDLFPLQKIRPHTCFLKVVLLTSLQESQTTIPAFPTADLDSSDAHYVTSSVPVRPAPSHHLCSFPSLALWWRVSINQEILSVQDLVWTAWVYTANIPG